MSSIYPLPTPEIAPQTARSGARSATCLRGVRHGALPDKIKQVIAVAIAHLTRCPYCIKGHTKAALDAGAMPEELMEAIWVAAEMRAGGAYAYSALMLATLVERSESGPAFQAEK